MVPSRSRNTAGRKEDCSGTLHRDGIQPRLRGGLYHVGCDRSHATMIGGAAAQKTWAAVRFLLNDAAARRDGSSSERIGGPKDSHYGQAYGSGHMHRTGIVTDEKMTPR